MRKEGVLILRLWNDSDHDGAGDADSAWRASLEDLRTKARVNFANLGQLAAYLKEGKAVVDDTDET